MKITIKPLYITLELIIALLIIVLGFILTDYLEGTYIALSSLSVPFLGLYLYENKWKYIGLGIILSASQLYFGFVFIEANSLH